MRKGLTEILSPKIGIIQSKFNPELRDLTYTQGRLITLNKCEYVE